jgi:flagellar protein FlaG
MSSDVGMTKSVLLPSPQTAPTAPVVRTEQDLRARQASGANQQPQENPERKEQKDSLGEMVSDLNQLVRELHRELRFSVDKESGETVIKVIDSKTDEVVRQIPSDELMALRRRLEEAAGVIFQDSA